MKISVLCTGRDHPIYPLLESWAAAMRDRHQVELVDRKTSLSGGDVLFLISCNEIIDASVRGRYAASLVVHASDLPEGRGWSPHIWQILEGKNRIKVTLLEAEDQVDSGRIWAQKDLVLDGYELFDEINDRMFTLELELMDLAISRFGGIEPRTQDDREPTYYPKRTPNDSRIDPDKSLRDQFDLLRVADPERFPAFLDLRGHRYYLRLSREGRKGK